MTQKLTRIVILSVVTVVAVVGMILANVNGAANGGPEESPAPAPAQKTRLTATPVSTITVAPETVAVSERYSGRLRPFETFTLSFEIAGRLKALGKDARGKPLDEGMRVVAGQTIAQLDDRQHRAALLDAEAQLDEAQAQLEQAQANLARVEELQAAGSRVITPEEYETRVLAVKESRARLKMAEARLLQAQKSLDDTTLVAPADGVISRRLVNPGESLNPHQAVFELVQIDEVLLVVGVPEADVRRIEAGQPVAVEFIGRDSRGRHYPEQSGRVYYVPPTADASSGLFEVEIVLSNPQGTLRPGLIGLARVTTEELPEAFRLPVAAVIFRNDGGEGTASIYTVTNQPPGGSPKEAASGVAYAQEFRLGDWIEQGQEIILTQLPPEHREVVVRGQYRLVTGRPVQVLSDAMAIAGEPPQRRPGAIVEAE